MWMIFVYEGDEDFERDVVERLKEELEVGCEEKFNFKYIGATKEVRGGY